MTSLADRTIAALRSTHDELAAVVPGLSDERLSGPSGAADWSVAQVLSHLGSGAEIALAGVNAAIAGDPAPPPDFNGQVWDRWNALAAPAQATGFLEHDSALVGRLESLTTQERERMQMPVSFLPTPLSPASVAGMRLNEAVMHSWDVRVALDGLASLDTGAVDLLVEHYCDGLGFLLGFAGKADALPQGAVVQLGDSGVAIVIGDRVELRRSSKNIDVTATFAGELEAAVRLMSGRLRTPYTPPGTTVTGNVTLDQLRQVFPGY